MIHIIIGTKAQYIKTAPLLRELDSRNIAYNFIDTGQHAQITKDLRQELSIREPNVYLRKEKDISAISDAFIWLVKYIMLATFSPKRISRDIFNNKKGICVIHGDTLSTLLSLYLAKRVGLKVAHIEAGLRSYNIFNPFPEEIVRIIAMKYSDILFSPSDWAYDNLISMNLKAKLINLKMNTNIESTRFALTCKSNLSLEIKNYCLITIHRAETIFNEKRMRFIVNLLLRIAKFRNLIFIMHKPTILSLKRYRLYNALNNSKNIELLRLLTHTDFINLLNNADFIITDGGSIQEESFYLGIPCLLMRKNTERIEGLDSNVYLSRFNQERIDYFISDYQKFRTNKFSNQNSPSEIIFQEIIKYA